MYNYLKLIISEEEEGSFCIFQGNSSTEIPTYVSEGSKLEMLNLLKNIIECEIDNEKIKGV